MSAAPPSSPPLGAPSGFEAVVIDAQTPFGTTGVPCLNALVDAGVLAPVDDVQSVVVPDYGREGHAFVHGSRVALAKHRPALEAFFGALPVQWRLPSSHGLRFGRASWSVGAATQWGARVVRSSPAIGASDVTGVRLREDHVEVELSKPGGEVLETMSAGNVGQRVAILVENEVLADPIFNERISAGVVRITLDGGREAHRRVAERLERALGA